jgi:hypothetical protein
MWARIDNDKPIRRLFIDCDFEDDAQTLIMDPASQLDYDTLVSAVETGDPQDVLLLPCRVSPGGPSASRVVRLGRIRSIREDRS